ncbi:t-SNARE [Neocallimastix californiae]|jgi:t-SNARE complex subunit (syntaxin)|uniref:t-SNARE n=1 Tax=Neocallimastix californiae TaxID=1754190 RepID=A0A1Y2ECN7_9FUNG|nr:t-SNARE [Neocallimastix californiae]|eukprot:ORY69348.1 t-SNARE [Neocallimastix californiae]
MYRDRLTELRGNQGYNKINDSQYDDNYGRSNNSRGGAYSQRSQYSQHSRQPSQPSQHSPRSPRSQNSPYSQNGHRSQRSGGTNNYGGAYTRDNGYSSSSTRDGGRDDVSSQYSGRINNLNADIKSLWNYIDRLDSLYNRNYNEVRRAENAENARRISELEERVTGEIQKITNQLKRIKAEGERISNPRDKRMVLSLVNNASNNLKKVFDSYNEKRKRYAEQGRNKIIRQYQIVHKNASREEAERYADNHPGGSLQYSMLSGSKSAYDEAKQVRDQMEQINQSINELCDLFQDMNNMLITQNETINVIEENVDTAEYNVEEASKELTRAIEIRKKSRKKLWIITGIILVVITALVIMFLPQIMALINLIKGLFSFGKSDEPETASTNVDANAAAGNQNAWDSNQQQQQQQPQQQQQQWA